MPENIKGAFRQHWTMDLIDFESETDRNVVKQQKGKDEFVQ